MSLKTDKYIDEHFEELLEHTREIVRIPSVEAEASGPASPYGKNVRDAEDYMLKVAGSEYGFETHENEGLYCYVDAGMEEGVDKEMLALVCHLDVVPEGSGGEGGEGRRACRPGAGSLTCGSRRRLPAAWMSSQPRMRKSVSLGRSSPSCMEGVGESRSSGISE